MLALAAGMAAGLAPELGRRRLRRSLAAAQAARERRLAMLEADPLRATYAQRIRAGEAWNDAQIAYDLDPGASGVCEHLWPIEQAMRREGVAVKLQRERIVDADCRIDMSRLQARGWPPANVSYAEPQLDGRAHEDPRYALLGCTVCNSAIHMQHPTDAPQGTPWWP